MEEDDGAPPPTPEKVKLLESEESKELLLKEEESSKQIEEEDDEVGHPPLLEESKPIEEDDDDDDEDEDGAPPLPLLEEEMMMMIDLPPPSSPLPPTPPLPSSPPTEEVTFSSSDLNMEQEDSEDEGPPPGWDDKCQLKEQVEEVVVTPAVVSAISSEISDIKVEDVQQDARNEDGPQPQAHEHPSPTQELVSSDIKMEQEDSEDEGPPPGWDSKCQTEPELQMACQTTPHSDMKTEDVQQDARDEDGPQPQAQAHEHLSPTRELVPSDIKVEQEDSEDEGPPPGWDSKCQPEPELQMACETTPPRSEISDIKAEDIQQDARDEDGPQPQAHEHRSPTREVVPPDIKVEQEDSEDEGPPPGWDAKCQTEPGLQMACQTTPRSDFKMENDEQDAQDEEGPPPGWESTPQQQSQDHSSMPSPIVTSGARMGCEQNNVKVVEERPQQPSRQQSIPPTKPQISAPKPPTPVNNAEMGQMVCGSCRRLLSYPRGARYVECACCLEENYVLEEHEVGQVICEGCNVLLMYPYGAPKVRCANCRAETKIGDQNRRPPLSEHRRRAKRHLKRMHPD